MHWLLLGPRQTGIFKQIVISRAGVCTALLLPSDYAFAIFKIQYNNVTVFYFLLL